MVTIHKNAWSVTTIAVLVLLFSGISAADPRQLPSLHKARDLIQASLNAHGDQNKVEAWQLESIRQLSAGNGQ